MDFRNLNWPIGNFYLTNFFLVVSPFVTKRHAKYEAPTMKTRNLIWSFNEINPILLI